ncbi:MAG: alkaline phosphatase family protein [Epsilonproteobacteria bacterium]|nr:MAG: alkaline phosphatase family protein [Campylobacterota bacterium]
MKKPILGGFFAIASLLFLPTICIAVQAPKLILQITIDALRSDLPGRYMSKMGDGGFKYLYNQGIVYEDAHHAHSNTETIVGHTTLATGAYPSRHGLIGNVWYDRTTGHMTYNIEDHRYTLLSKGADVDKSTEVDPTQRAARSEGRSPSAILVSTFSDELSIHTDKKAKVFGVSVKDRGAVSMAGHAGKAFWFSKAKGEFVTSSFYYDEYPAWVNAFNATKPALAYENKSWKLMYKPSEYMFGDKDDQAWETDVGGFGKTFPHPYGTADGKYFTTFLTLSPAGDDMTLDFTKKLIEHEDIGKDDVTDYLSVSFSSTDYVGHVFGPSSLEAEDSLLRLDKTLADLFTFVDKHVGLANTLIVLSSDHGGPEAPPQVNEYGIEANYIDPEKWDKHPAISKLKKLFGVGQELIEAFNPPYIYLNKEIIKKNGFNLGQVEEVVADEIMKFKGVSQAVSSTALMEGRVANTEDMRLILNSHNPKRSGDIFILFEPNWFINDFDGLTVACTHGSLWNYDTFVPVIFAGANIQPRKVYRKIETVDVARTLSAYVNVKPPSGANGKILTEVLEST